MLFHYYRWKVIFINMNTNAKRSKSDTVARICELPVQGAVNRTNHRSNPIPSATSHNDRDTVRKIRPLYLNWGRLATHFEKQVSTYAVTTEKYRLVPYSDLINILYSSAECTNLKNIFKMVPL